MSMNEFYKDLLTYLKKLRKQEPTRKYDNMIHKLELEFKTKRNTNEPIMF